MSATATTNVLITGANRGIGRGLTEHYLARPNYTVIAAVRDPSHETAKSLANIPVESGTKLITVKIDSLSETEPKAAVAQLTSAPHNLSHLDVVIANSGIAKYIGSVLETPVQELRDHFNVNTIGPLILFQAVWPLLSAVTPPKQPKFIVVSSVLGSISEVEIWLSPATAYGSSKAAVNYIARKIHLENESLICFPIHPGWVQTDMGNRGAAMSGLEQAPETVNGSVQGIVKQIDSATREKTSGTYVSYDGMAIGW